MPGPLKKRMLRNGLLCCLCLLAASGLSDQSVTIAAEPAPIRFLKTWGQQGDQPGEFHFPIDIAINAGDEIFVTDHLNDRVQKFDRAGKLLAQFPVLPNPGGLAFDKQGNLVLSHILASGSSKHKIGDRISIYSPQGKLIRQWGKPGKGPGEFNCPGGIAVADNGRIYVADQTNHRVQVFDPTGQFLFEWGKHGSQPGEFGGKGSPNSRVGGPQFLAFDSKGNLWTTEGANCRVQQFTAEGKLLQHWGTDADTPGGLGGYFSGFDGKPVKSLTGPIAVCVDQKDRLWISAVSGRVQQFSPAGKYLRSCGEKQGTAPGEFYAPHGMAFDSHGDLYVVDAYNHRIQKFAVGP
ncbi:Virginiamycin B lyase [Gimesia panareensis]|uniref:Virginiamycin B lyase n=1 Tax=Gimesia panareensis TaxID=2527978 RepID=A0A517Q7Z9_9PLAN|nr:Virginiamycin B lyase [Gimesia panareensis]